MEKQKPAHTIRLGRIKAAVWKNQNDDVTRYNVTVCRIYKNGDAWKESASYGRDDLPLVCKALDQAHTWIFEQAAA
jgi:hypothetical protein